MPAPEIDLPEDDVPQPAVPDLVTRRKKVRAMVDARSLAGHQAANPFSTGLDPAPRVSDRTYAEAENEVTQVEHEAAMRDRATAVEQRRGQVEQQKARNAQLMAHAESTGLRTYRDPYGDLKPVVEAETGREVYTEADLGVGKDAQGRPGKIRRNRYGETEHKRAPLRQSENPLEGNLLYDMGDGQSEMGPTFEEALKDPDVQVRRMAAVAKKAQQVAQDKHESLVEEDELRKGIGTTDIALRSANVAMQRAQAELSQVTKQIETMAVTGAVDPALYDRKEQLDASLKVGGEIHGAVQLAEANKGMAKAKADLIVGDKKIAILQGRIGTPGERDGDPERLQYLLDSKGALGRAINKEIPKLLKGTPAPAAPAAPAKPDLVHPDKLPAEWAKSSPIERLKMMFGVKGYGRNEVEGAAPMIGSEAAGTKGGLATIPKMQGSGVMAGIDNAVNKFIAGLTTPENAAIMAATGGAGALADLAAATRVAVAARATEAATLGTFTGVMAKDTVTAAQEARAIMADPAATNADKADAIATAILSGAMTAAAGVGTKKSAGRTMEEARAAGRQLPPDAGGGQPGTPEPTEPGPSSVTTQTPSGSITITGKDAEAVTEQVLGPKIPPEQEARLRAEADRIAGLPEDQQLAATEELLAREQGQAASDVVPSAPQEAAPTEDVVQSAAQAERPSEPIPPAPESIEQPPTVRAEEATPPPEPAQTSSEAAPISEHREPWQMTKAEWQAGEVADIKQQMADPEFAKSGMKQRRAQARIAETEAATAHEAQVYHALKRGDVVPPEVLAEYPGLTPDTAPVPIGPRDPTVSTGDGVPTAKEEAMLAEQRRLIDEHNAAQKPIKEENSGYQRMMARAARRNADESKGQAILDEMESNERSPNSAIEEFWRDTYPNLDRVTQDKFERLIKRETGFQLGDVIGSMRDKTPIVAKSWQDIYPDSANEVGHLEGTERGLVALMEAANMRQRATPTVPLAPELPSGDPTPPAQMKPAARIAAETKSIAAKLPEVSTPEIVEGDKLSKEWTAFSPESQSLGIPRADMPQIKSEHRGAMVNFLKARGIAAKPGMILPTKLKPTQAEFSPAKVEAARKHEGSERAILISDDGHVVDGHHQWMAALDDPTTPMPVIRLGAPVKKLLTEVLQFPSAETTSDGKPAAQAKAAPSATKPLAQRTLDRLDKAIDAQKKNMQGKVFDAGTGLVEGGKLAALQIARIAVRTGMAVNDVVRLALARFKAVHPKHTAAELVQVEADVRTALSEPPPTPAEPVKKKSLLPESLKAAGAPVESINYQVRPQALVKAEASDYIRAFGPKKAEARLADKAVPGDERVAIGGELINERMLALKNADPEKAATITSDIQRITAKMQPELATQAGQTVSMFGGIYGDVRVASGIEYARSQNEKFKRDIGGEDAERATQATKEAVEKAKGPKDVAEAIEALKAKHTTKPARKVLDAFQKQIDAVLEMKRIGALDNEALMDLAGKELKLARVNPTRMKLISEMAGRVQNAATPAERAKADIDLIEVMGFYKSDSIPNILTSLYTANILSRPTTQGANLTGTSLQSLTNLAITAATNPRQIRPLLDGLLRGLPLGFNEAKSIIATGRATRDFQDKSGGVGNLLNVVDVARDYPKVGAILPSIPISEGARKFLNVGETADPVTLGLRGVEKVYRFLKAADATFYYPSREAYARVLATKIHEAKYSGPELAKKVDEFLHTTPEAFRSATVQAQREGYSGIDIGRRVADIIEERRMATADGKDVVRKAEKYAAESTFQQDPEGLAGVAYHALKYAVDEGKLAGWPVLKPAALFLKTPANVINEVGNYVPGIGVVRAQFGMRGPGMRSAPWRSFSKEERNALYVKQLIGGVLLGGLLTRILNGKDDVDVTAQGPTNAAQRKQWRDGGGIPYSIGVGGKRIVYKDSPFVLPLAIIGNVADSVRYQKAKSDMILGDRVTDAVLRSPQVIFNLSFLTTMADFMAALADGDIRGVSRTLGSIPANMAIPFNGALQQVDQAFDNQSYRNNPVVGAIPFARRTGEPISDIQGRPQTYDPAQRFVSTESTDSVDALLRERNLYIPEVGKDARLDRKVFAPAQIEARVAAGAPAPAVGDRPIMSDAEREQYRTLSGQRIRIRLQALAPILHRMSQADAQRKINSLVEEERDRVRGRIGLTPTR